MRPAIEQGVAVATGQPSDAPELARLHAACFARDWDEESIRRYIGEPACMVVVARQSGAADPRGFLIGRASGGEAEILTLAVVPETRRAGHRPNPVACRARAASGPWRRPGCSGGR